MTVARRLTDLEGSLTPTQRVLAWLDEAHAFGSLEAYVESLLDEPPEAHPVNRLAREAAAGARSWRHGASDGAERAVRKAVRETVFRFELVIRVNVKAHESVDRESLVYALLASQIALLVTEGRDPREADAAYRKRLAMSRDVAFGRVDEMLASTEARTTVEGRYLEGHMALFPEVAEACTRQVRLSQELAVTAERLAELDGIAPFHAPNRAVLAARVSVLQSDLVEPARSTALAKLGDGPQAFAIATRWMRSANGAR